MTPNRRKCILIGMACSFLPALLILFGAIYLITLSGEDGWRYSIHGLLVIEFIGEIPMFPLFVLISHFDPGGMIATVHWRFLIVGMGMVGWLLWGMLAGQVYYFIKSTGHRYEQ